jgi:hypothetical protein
MHATHTIHLILLSLIALIIFSEKYNELLLAPTEIRGLLCTTKQK